jgi:N-acetylmuramoyl-L-alanine amidase
MYVSAGHSNSDPGAVAHTQVRHSTGTKVASMIRREADIACEFRNMVSFYLSQKNIAHETDGTGTDNMPLSSVVKRSRNHRVAVEFHCNASSNQAATGVEVLCSAKDADRADAICKAISKALGIRNRGVKPENAGQHHRLAFVQAGGMIVELFFITNPADLAAYDARKWVAAKAVATVLSG